MVQLKAGKQGQERFWEEEERRQWKKEQKAALVTCKGEQKRGISSIELMGKGVAIIMQPLSPFQLYSKFFKKNSCLDWIWVTTCYNQKKMTRLPKM